MHALLIPGSKITSASQIPSSVSDSRAICQLLQLIKTQTDMSLIWMAMTGFMVVRKNWHRSRYANRLKAINNGYYCKIIFFSLITYTQDVQRKCPCAAVIYSVSSRLYCCKMVRTVLQMALYHDNRRKDSFRLLKPVILLCSHPPDSLLDSDTHKVYTPLWRYRNWRRRSDKTTSSERNDQKLPPSKTKSTYHRSELGVCGDA